MNCIIHNDTPAVGSCGKCGCGICSACVQNSIKADGIDKPVCVNCAVEGVGLYIEYLKTLLKATRTKKNRLDGNFACRRFFAYLRFRIDKS